MTTNGLNQPKRVSVEEYLVNEARAEYKSEYHNGIVVPVHRTVNEQGEVVAMAGAKPAHTRLAIRLSALLEFCLADTDCLVYSSDQLVHTPECKKYHYPDVSVVCKKPEFEKRAKGLDALLNPSIIIEVLSESTEAYDRGEKFNCYRTLPSFEQYVVVDSKQQRIETFTKQDEKHWLMTFAREADDKVKIGSCEFTVGEIYRKVFLE
jgi:Uma2 family endonuclease